MSETEGAEELVRVAVQTLRELPPWTLCEVSERIAAFNAKDPANISSEQIAELMDKLTYAYFVVPMLIPSKTVLVRGRFCKEHETFPSWRDIHYPRDHSLVGAGRANVPGSPVLYCAEIHETVFAELRLAKGDCVNIAEIEVSADDGCRFVTIGDVQQIRRYGKSSFNSPAYDAVVVQILDSLDLKTAMAIQLVDAFFADRFSRKGTPDEYRITAGIVQELTKAGFLDAVAYRSVEHFGGVNYAFRPQSADQKLKYLRFEATKILESYGYGMYEGGIYACAQAHSNQPHIPWERSFELTETCQ